MTLQAYQPGQPKFHTVHQQTFPPLLLPPTVSTIHLSSSLAILAPYRQHYVQILFDRPLLRPLLTLLSPVIPQCILPTQVGYLLNQHLPSLPLLHRPPHTLCPFQQFDDHLPWMASVHMFIHGWLLHLLHPPKWSLSNPHHRHFLTTQDSILRMSLLSKSFLPQILGMVSSIRGSSVPSSWSSLPNVLLSLNDYEDVVYLMNFHEWPIKTRPLEEGSHLAQSLDIPNYHFSPSILVDVFASYPTLRMSYLHSHAPKGYITIFTMITTGFFFCISLSNFLAFPSSRRFWIPPTLLPLKKR